MGRFEKSKKAKLSCEQNHMVSKRGLMPTGPFTNFEIVCIFIFFTLNKIVCIFIFVLPLTNLQISCQPRWLFPTRNWHVAVDWRDAGFEPRTADSKSGAYHTIEPPHIPLGAACGSFSSANMNSHWLTLNQVASMAEGRRKQQCSSSTKS